MMKNANFIGTDRTLLYENVNIFDGPEIEFCYEDTLEKSEVLHFHDFSELYVYVSGDVGYFIDGRYYDLERGDLVIIRPNELHHSLIHKECHYERYFFKFPKGCFPAPASGMSSPIAFIESPIPGRLVRLPVEERSEVLRAVAEIRDLTMNKPENYMTLAYAKTLGILARVGRALTGENVPVVTESMLPKLVENIVNSLSVDLSSPPTAESTAKKFGISCSYLSRVFKKYMGMNYTDYLTALRISRAKNLLNAGATVTEACYECGFSDCSHFIAVFKAQVGVTPLKYKSGGCG